MDGMGKVWIVFSNKMTSREMGINWPLVLQLTWKDMFTLPKFNIAPEKLPSQ